MLPSLSIPGNGDTAATADAAMNPRLSTKYLVESD
jgi:hypothetical protein